MSVIMAYMAEDKLYLGADNRSVTIDETTYNDNVNNIKKILQNLE